MPLTVGLARTLKVLQNQYITVETLYKAYIRVTNDVLKLTTPQILNVTEKKEETVRRK
jgi:hypothetical protein